MLKKTILMSIVCTLTVGSFAAEKKYSEADYQTAYQLFAATDMAAGTAKSIDGILDLQMKQNPKLMPFRSIFEKFFRKYMSFENLKETYAELYLGIFTPEEIRQLTEFYRTPLGRKVASVNPKLTLECAAVGQRIVREHIGELQGEIVRAMADMKAKELENNQNKLNAANAAVKGEGAVKK